MPATFLSMLFFLMVAKFQLLEVSAMEYYFSMFVSILFDILVWIKLLKSIFFK